MLPASISRRRFVQGASLAAVCWTVRGGRGQEPAGAEAIGSRVAAAADKGIEFLRVKGQAADGSFSKQVGTGVTALAATALLRHGRSPDDPTVAKALKFLADSVQPTGGIHLPNGRLKTYETCVAVVCFEEANRDHRYDKILKDADKFLKELPFDAAEGHDPSSFYFGGAGYGGQGRPDLSNTAYLIDALKSTGNSPDTEAIKNALTFVSRCQNLESEHNTTPFASKINDGGFYYSPIPGRGEDADVAGGLRSYGAMSSSGLKSMVFAGVKQDDPRVKAVVKWIGKHYDLKSHPGQGSSGLYYYYHTFAKALDAFGQDSIEDDRGQKHDWRKDLIDELASRQREDGSWVNSNQQFFESDANLSTSFALLALSHARPAKSQTRK
jgi:squalene-hopene/tetraprenyl-beta-curcumene cyclase